MLNGQILIYLLKFLFHVNYQIKDAMVEMPKLLMNGYTKTILLMKLVLLIKLMGMITVLAVMHKSNAKTVFLVKAAGLNRGLKFTESNNMEK